MNPSWTPEAQLELIDMLAGRSGAETAALFGAWGLGPAYQSAGRYNSKRAEIAAGLEGARAKGIEEEVFEAAAKLVGLSTVEADEPEVTLANDKLFISHAGADRDLADLFQRALIIGGVPADRIFYSSARGTGIPAGEEVAAFLRQSLHDSGLVVELLTTTFLTRPRCLIELGAAWVSGKPTFPIVVPALTVQAVREAIGDFHYIPLEIDASSRDLMLELQDRLKSNLGLTLSSVQWDGAVRELDNRLADILGPHGGRGPIRAEAAGSEPATVAEFDDDDAFTFSKVVVRNGNLYGEATNRDSIPHSAILTITFYNAAGDILETEQVAINDIRPGRGKVFTVRNAPDHAARRIEVATLL